MEQNTMVSTPRTLGASLRLVFAGYVIGAANLIPGVSGGTMALILGIYEQMLDAIRSVSDRAVVKALLHRDFRQVFALVPWQFLMALGVGAFLSVITLSRLIEWLLETYPRYIAGFFFGLVAASIWVVAKEVRRWGVLPGVGFVVGAVGAWLLMSITPATTPETPWLLFLSALVAIGAMVLPGISGAFVLIVFGQYQYALSAVNNRDLFLIIVVLLGAGVGLITFARGLSWLFKKQHDLTLAVLAGLVLGSLRKLWPWHELSADALSQINYLPTAWTAEATLVVVMMVVGLALVLALGRE